MKKRAFTLIEMLIVLALTGLLLTTLFFWFHLSTTSQKMIKEAQWTLLEERYCDQKLEKLFSRVVKNEQFVDFFSIEGDCQQIQGKNLVCYFNHGPHINPKLAGTVLTRLYLDQQSHCLCLGVWPVSDQQPSLTIPLLDQVSEIDFSFYHPPETNLSVDPDRIDTKTPQKGWQEHWDSAFESLPAIVKIAIHREATPQLEPRTLEWTYEISEAKQRIIYHEKIERAS